MQGMAQRAAAPVFALTMFFSAALIFILQPMFARMTTPLLGGSPAVWNTSMVFFQAALLVGYGYAHALARLQSLRTQVVVHGVALAVGCIALPITVSMAFGPPDPAAPSMWLFGVLAASVGLPYAAASATAPLLQAWFARTGRPDAHDPYYLYAASNLGSLLGLLAYPALLEPLMGLSAQRMSWSFAYGGLIIFVLACGFAALASRSAAGEAQRAPATEGPPAGPSPDAAPSGLWARWKQRLFWMAAAAAPSSLLLGVTTHISTDVASAPFLWVAPLALYLLTFVIAFARTTQGLSPLAAIGFPIALAVLMFMFSYVGFVMTLSAHLTSFFLAALVCHFALAQSRPDASRLTEFYMWVSTGGVIGGALTALVAPVVFNDVFEYPIALAAAALFLPRVQAGLPRLAITALLLGVALLAALRISSGLEQVGHMGLTPEQSWLTAFLENEDVRKGLGIAFLGGLAVAATALPVFAAALAMAAIGTLVLLTYLFTQGNYGGELVFFLALCVCGAAVFANRTQPALVAALVLVAFATIRIDQATGQNTVFQERSFFGVTRVMTVQFPQEAAPVRVMVHGTTTHGAQFVAGPRAQEPLTYYSPSTGLGFATLKAANAFPKAHIGLIGLGAGSSACLRRAQDTVTIYEIDPKIVRLSASRGMDGIFTYVPLCAPEAKVVIGDGRLSVSKEPDGGLDVLVVDAFSSDAVPAHLLTREAIRGYMQKLSPRGLVILHLSNRNLDLVGEASRVARAEGLGALWADTPGASSYPGDYTAYATTTMVIGRSQEVVDALQLGPEWKPARTLEGRAWSDEYVNFIRPLFAMLFPAPPELDPPPEF
jgi:hypothetical protein